MLFSTVIEILASVFIVYGIYFTLKTLLFFVLYPKNIRNAVQISVIYEKDDDDDIKVIKRLCAEQIIKDNGLYEKVRILKETKEKDDS